MLCIYYNCVLSLFYPATLTASSSVYCPDESVFFTCSVPGVSINSPLRWEITPPGQTSYSISLATSNIDETQGMFRGVLTNTSGGMITATLTSLTVASTVEGTMVQCRGESSIEAPLTITVAGE